MDPSLAERSLVVCAVIFKQIHTYTEIYTYMCWLSLSFMPLPHSCLRLAGHWDENHYTVASCVAWKTVHPHHVGLVIIYSLTVTQSST